MRLEKKRVMYASSTNTNTRIKTFEAENNKYPNQLQKHVTLLCDFLGAFRTYTYIPLYAVNNEMR